MGSLVVGRKGDGSGGGSEGGRESVCESDYDCDGKGDACLFP